MRLLPRTNHFGSNNPPLSENSEHNIEIEWGTQPTITSPLMTATAYGSETLQTSLLHNSNSPITAVQISL